MPQHGGCGTLGSVVSDTAEHWGNLTTYKILPYYDLPLGLVRLLSLPHLPVAECLQSHTLLSMAEYLRVMCIHSYFLWGLSL